MPRTILIPVELGEPTNHCIEWAKANVLLPSDEVVLAHAVKKVVLDNQHYLWSDSVLTSVARQNQEYETKAKAVLETFAHQLGSDKKVDIQILHGDPRTAIETYATALKPDFVIIGSRGLRGLKKAIMGSTAEYLVHHLAIPVLIVH
ncbi:hypothetical protein HDU91_002861 [Kappamyces sp. JEL0680]|nr:hypothetical protein HDU91_002861 [Kappamyces sp. JEL0680]